jgi:hypothetical protein
MKKLIIAISMFPMCATLAQTNWTFQWHGQERGIIFVQTNLSKSVKAAIRDDIAQVMSKVVASDITIYPARPDHPDLGKVDGLMDFVSKVHACPNNFPLGYYRMINGTPFFLLSEEECSVYASAVALTNQYASAIGTLSNFLASAEAMTTANTTTNAFLQKFWHLDKNRVLKMSDEPEMNFPKAIQTWGGDVRHIYPSILQFKYDTDERLKCLHAEIKTVKKNDPQDGSTVHVVYKNGKWRFLVWDW